MTNCKHGVNPVFCKACSILKFAHNQPKAWEVTAKRAGCTITRREERDHHEMTATRSGKVMGRFIQFHDPVNRKQSNGVFAKLGF